MHSFNKIKKKKIEKTTNIRHPGGEKRKVTFHPIRAYCSADWTVDIWLQSVSHVAKHPANKWGT